jgi:PIN domain nuclease of toxin-antitoxin system
MSLVLDTNVFLRWNDSPDRLSKEQRRALKGIGPEKTAYIADVTLWELANLASAGRLKFKLPLREWFELALERPHLEVHPITPAVACEVASLGNGLHKDPADRIIVATARVLGASLLTTDQLIIDSGAVRVVA